MREILFRGKRVDNGEWIEGYLVKLGRESFSDPERYGVCNKAVPLGGSGVCYNLRIDEVIPETVGQYTGLIDKNGKKIFEGDILSFSDRLVYVNWHDYCGCWDCSYIKAVKGKATLHEDRSPDKWRYNAVVIGNIHDNPELLKGGEG